MATELAKPSAPKSSRSRTLDSAVWYAQQESVLADVEAQVKILEAEAASINHQVADLKDLGSAIRQGLIILQPNVMGETEAPQQPAIERRQAAE